MRGGLRPDGVRNASPARVTEWVLIGAAAIETILVAALALLVAGGRGSGGSGARSGVIGAFERLNAPLLLPLDVLLPGADALARQIAAILLYAVCFVVLAGAASWIERRRALS